ncbi:Predicted PurR-regulated permease PerM [Enhydrobacter aerosaccus]|uniref:Predicted PurR-regulated permease PerM n=2 Tax=Enhydrobacter aerosaccus TaxID=225324 RepID=A0A1T4JJZ0_9HYPH|nr:Predicted PurR-regulated permease PerM [Enhydrobacter aerosaccus]
MRMTLQRAALWAIVIAATMYLLVAARGLILPFVLAMALWYMVDAVADAIERPRLGRLRVPRPLALLAAVLIMSGLVGVVGRTLGHNVSAVAAAAPAYEGRLQKLLDQLAALAGMEQAPTLGQLFDRISLADTLGGVATFAASLVSVAGIVLIYAGFLFVEQVRFRRKLAIIFGPGEQQARVLSVLEQIDRDIRVYLRIKTVLAVATSILAYAVMAWVGVDFAGFWATMIFFFYYIPTVGSILAIVAPAVLTLVQFDHLTPFLIVLFVIGTIQIVMANVIEPAIMGRSLNLSPLVVIVSLMVWGTMWGVIGMFLCVPIMVVLLIVLAHFESTRPVAILLSADGRIPEAPHEPGS